MDISEAIDSIKSFDLDDIKKIGTAPKPLQYAVKGLVACIIIGLAVWLLIIPKLDALTAIKSQEPILKKVFEEEQRKVANLAAYKVQLDEMRKSFGTMLRQLPNTIDIESLLIDLSQTGVSSGLEVDSFIPEQEIPKEFYASYPIKLSVTGTYHEFGRFVSGLAALPRIVTLHDISIKPIEKSPGELKMQLTAMTYRYLEEDN